MIIVRTAPRKGVDYLPELVAAVEAEGFKGAILNDQEYARTGFPGWDCKATGATTPLRGARQAGWVALQLVTYYGEDCLLLEDDVMPVPGAVRTMLEHVVPAHQMWVSFWDNKRSLPRTPGTFSMPAKEFSGSLAMKVPLRTARAVIWANPWRFDHPQLLPLHDWDRALGLFCVAAEIGNVYGLRRPSLVERAHSRALRRCGVVRGIGRGWVRAAR